jgi:hypothetical protein
MAAVDPKQQRERARYQWAIAGWSLAGGVAGFGMGYLLCGLTGILNRREALLILAVWALGGLIGMAVFAALLGRRASWVRTAGVALVIGISLAIALIKVWLLLSRLGL